MKNTNEKKKILLLIPTDYNLYSLVEKNLVYLGYDVTVVLHHSGRFSYSNLWERIRNFIRRSLFNDHVFKKKLLMRFNGERQLSEIQATTYYDYGLVFRADFFGEDVLGAVRGRVGRLVAFHYDGLGTSKGIFERIRFFDKFCVFDKRDVRRYPQYDLTYEPNFYFDYPEEATNKAGNRSNLYYLASFHKSRNHEVIAFHQYAKTVFDQVTFEMVVSRKDRNRIPRYIRQHMAIHHQHIPFAEHLERVKESSVMLDFRISLHQGYSFRVFEALKHQKKLITTNPDVRHADFFHPDNIYVLDQGNDGLLGFLNKPYVSLPEEIVNKYSFSNWLKRLFDT